jgi:hypothetical protein
LRQRGCRSYLQNHFHESVLFDFLRCLTISTYALRNATETLRIVAFSCAMALFLDGACSVPVIRIRSARLPGDTSGQPFFAVPVQNQGFVLRFAVFD